MSDPLQNVWDALERAGCDPRGELHSFTALCPVHSDHNPSLSVDVGADGRALLCCRSHGCETNNVRQTLGLAWSELFPDGHMQAHPARRPRFITERALVSFKRALAGAGITWRPAADPDMIIVRECPACVCPDLWLFDDGRTVHASCWRRNCSSEQILSALAREVEVQHAA